MALAGKGASLGLAANPIGGLNDISFNLEGDNLDITVFDEDFRLRLQGLKSATINGSGFRDPTDTQQNAIQTAWLNGTVLSDVRMLFDGTNGIECDAFVSSFDIGATVAGEVTVSFTLESDGAISVLP